MDANFIDSNTGLNRCLKCIQGFQEIDPGTEKFMDEFESIKLAAARAIRENSGTGFKLRDWKQQIRQTLLRVKKDFVTWIDDFTLKFTKQIE